ncbi:dystroglycan isoform X3 [Contarinia nasturtii]|uniref:dystroglycan isoform X3 n=1 Tax=Contarinia nasturtii TaxID=265458 RepID=UPI0012D42353|nr:dystroglycan isoform X3 [Contarinia nasturtii]
MQEMQSSNCQRRYGMARKWVVSVILMLTTIVFAINAEQHNIDSSIVSRADVQAELPGPMTYTDDAQRHSQKLATYKKELLGCPNTSKKVILSLILRTNSWDDIIDNKRDRALSKLSKLFGVPKDLMVTSNIIQRDISEMEKNSIEKGKHVPSERKRFGKLEFVIGCSDYFTNSNTIAKRISRQMEENLISETSGLNFDWWCIWEKQPNYRMPRSKRDAAAGEEVDEEADEEDYYYDDDNESTDAPVEPKKIEQDVIEHDTDEHPHRHHHGDETTSLDVTQSSSPSLPSTSPLLTSTSTTSQESPSTLTTPKLNAIETTESQSTTLSTTIAQSVNLPVSITNKIESAMPITNVPISSSESIQTESTLRTTELTTPKVTLPAKNNGGNLLTPSTVQQPSNAGVDQVDTTESNDDDDDYDDDNDYDEQEGQQGNVPLTPTTNTTSPETTTPEPTTTAQLVTTSSTTTLATTTTTEAYVEPENVNNVPVIKARLAKLAVTAGKPFNHIVPLDTFYDTEDGTNLKLELLDKYEKPLEAKSWIQFNAETRNIYGLPLEDAVSKWQFKLRATDSANESVFESLDISVQQHKSYRSVNHEIIIAVNLLNEFASNVDWEMRLIKGIVDILGDTQSVLVRDIRYGILDPNAATFIYTNESLPKDICPETQLNEIIEKLTPNALNNAVSPQMSIKSIEGKTIGTCSKPETVKPTAPKPTQHVMKNYPPIARNQVDRVNATINQLLVFKVPSDTFYDPEDGTDLKLSLLTYERSELDPKYWLQFDSKNKEFFGVPKFGDAGQREYVLVAEDREGLQATDALVVVVSQPSHREYSTAFEFTLNMQYDEFNNSAAQRRFIERIAQIYNDPTTSNIQIRSIRKIHQTGATHVTFFNTTLHRPHNVCPNEEIDTLKYILVHKDNSIRQRVKDIIGNEFDLVKINLAPTGPCLPTDSNKILTANIPIKPDDTDPLSFKDDHLLTFVLPAVIIFAMLFLTCIIACVLHRRRMTGKMELGKYAGDEEERRAFRSKGIPVIFQDELDEKPEIGNKSPIILKDEKPPLLPPSYNSTNPDEELEDYIPPPAVAMSGRESRGKSPVTPSYRKPPPYVSP